MAGINASPEIKDVLRGISPDWLYRGMTPYSRPVSPLLFFFWMVAAHAGGTIVAVACVVPLSIFFANPVARLIMFGGSLFTLCLAADIWLQHILRKRTGRYATGHYAHQVSLWQAGFSAAWTLASLGLTTEYFSAGSSLAPRLALLGPVLFVVAGIGYVSTLLALWASCKAHQCMFAKEDPPQSNT